DVDPRWTASSLSDEHPWASLSDPETQAAFARWLPSVAAERRVGEELWDVGGRSFPAWALAEFEPVREWGRWIDERARLAQAPAGRGRCGDRPRDRGAGGTRPHRARQLRRSRRRRAVRPAVRQRRPRAGGRAARGRRGRPRRRGGRVAAGFVERVRGAAPDAPG